MMKEVNEGLIVTLRIIPNSSKNNLILQDGLIKVKITAQPIENKANKALIEFLSKQFKIPKSSIEIIRGETSKDKTILFKINDVDKLEQIKTKLRF